MVQFPQRYNLARWYYVMAGRKGEEMSPPGWKDSGVGSPAMPGPINCYHNSTQALAALTQ